MIQEDYISFETDEQYPNGAPAGYDVYQSVDKDSILQVKQRINYE